MAEISVAEKYFQEGKYSEACQIYNILLIDEPRNSHLLQAKVYCCMSLCQWHDCFKTILNAYECSNWNLSYVENFVANLVEKLSTKWGSVDNSVNRQKRQTNEFEENLICECCYEVLCDPITISCGHTFCRQCLLNKNKCLSCTSSNVNKIEDLSANNVLTNIVENCFQAKTKATQLRYEGNECFANEKYENAVKKYTEAISLDPSNHFILGNLSHVYSVLEEYQTALDYADKACRKTPNWAKGFYRKAQAYVGLKNYSQAAICFLEVLLIDPQNQTAHKSLNKVFVELLTNEAKLANPNVSMIDDLASSMNVLIESHELDPKVQMIVSCVEDDVTSLLSERLNIADLQCSLCYRLYYDPVTCPCGHTFCQWCLNRCLDHQPFCPVCRYLIKECINTENQSVTRSIQAVCKKYFPKEFERRKHEHEVEVKKLASVASDTNEDVPIFVCTLAIPTIPCRLCIFEPRYRLMIRECMESGSRQFGMCCPSEINSFSDYGVMLEIEDVNLLPDGRSLVNSIGGRRFKVLNRGTKDGYNTAKVEWLKDYSYTADETEIIRNRQLSIYANIVAWFSSLSIITKIQLFAEMGIPSSPPECDHENIDNRNGPNWIWWSLNLLPMPPSQKIQIISMTDIRQRLDKIEQFFRQNADTP